MVLRFFYIPISIWCSLEFDWSQTPKWKSKEEKIWTFLIILIHFSELKWKENSALGKPVEGSSIFGNNSADWDPSYATDGLVLNRCPKIFHSNFEPSPWIKVDLMNPLTISFIRVFNRPDVLGIYNIYYMYLLSSYLDISELLWKETHILNNSLQKRTLFFRFKKRYFFKISTIKYFTDCSYNRIIQL